MPARRRHVGYELDNNFDTSTSNGDWSQQHKHEISLNSGQFVEEESLKKEDSVVPKMTSRDRTNEFINAIQVMQNKTVAGNVISHNPRRAQQMQTYSNFMMIAKTIGKNIAHTYIKLEKLALCKFMHSLYDEP